MDPDNVNINLDFDSSIYLAWKCFAEKNNILVENNNDNLDFSNHNILAKNILEFIGNEYSIDKQKQTVKLQFYKNSLLLKNSPSDFKKDISKMGGKWNRTLRGWIIPTSKRYDLISFFDNKILYDLEEVEEDSDCDDTYWPDEQSNNNIDNANNKIKLKLRPYKKALLLKGDTRDLKDSLSSIGRWNGPLNGWIFTKKSREKLSLFFNELEEDNDMYEFDLKYDLSDEEFDS